MNGHNGEINGSFGNNPFKTFLVDKGKVQSISPLPSNSGNFFPKSALISGKNSVVQKKSEPKRGQ